MSKLNIIIELHGENLKLNFFGNCHSNSYIKGHSQMFMPMKFKDLKMNTKSNSTEQGSEGYADPTPVYFVDNCDENREWRPVRK